MTTDTKIKKVTVKPPGVLKFIEAGMLFLLLIIYFGIAAVHSERREVLSDAVSTLSAASTGKYEQFEDWANDCFEEVNSIVNNADETPLLESLLAGKSAGAGLERFTYSIRPIISIHKFRCLIFISPEGKIMYRHHENGQDLPEDEIAKTALSLKEDRTIQLAVARDSVKCFAFLLRIYKERKTIGFVAFGIEPNAQLAEVLHSSHTLSFPIENSLYDSESKKIIFHPLSEKNQRILPEELSNSSLSSVTPHEEISESNTYDPEQGKIYIKSKTEDGSQAYVIPRRIMNSNLWLLTNVPENIVDERISERITSTILMVILVGVIILGLVFIAGLMERRQYTQAMLASIQERAALENHYKYLIKYANDIIFLLDSESRILEMNDRALETYQYSRDELTGKLITALFPEDLTATIPVEYTMSTGRFRTTHRKKDNSTFPVEVSIRRFSGENEIYLQLIIRDFSEWSSYEKALKESEERYRLVADNVTDLIYKLNVKPSLKFEFISKAATRITGYTPEEYYNDPELCIRVIYPEDLRKVDVAFHTPDAPLVTRWIRKDGKIIWTEQVATMVYNENNELITITGIARDITERKNKELEESRLTAFNLLKSSVNEALLFSTDKDILFRSVCSAIVNRDEILTAGIVTSTKNDEIEFNPEEIRIEHQSIRLKPEISLSLINSILSSDKKAIEKLLENKKNLIYHTAGIIETEAMASGAVKYLLFPLSSSGRLTGFFVLLVKGNEELSRESLALLEETARNISLRIEYLYLEEQRRKSDLELVKVNKQLKALTARVEKLREDERNNLSGVLHDELGQSLTALKIDLTLLQKQNGNGNGNGKHELTSKSVQLIDSIISTVRNISAELRPELLTQLGLLPAIQSHCKEMQRRTGINISVIGDIQEDPDQDIKTALYRVYQEMLTNVVKHAHARNVTVTLFRDEYKIALTVEDDGKGFDEKDERSYLSLGLISMRERLANLNGQLIVNTAPGEGSVITAVIPFEQKQTAIPGAKPADTF